MATQYVAPVNGTWAKKGGSPFGAGRDGGRRLHAGNDLQAKNGAPVVASVGGTVIYAGHNSGYQWNAVVAGDDGNAFRYATHGPLTVKVGDRIEQGQQVGKIGRGHLHFEVIPGNSPVYKQMVANPGTFVGTQYYPGGKPVTVDPVSFFGVERGSAVAAGRPVGTGAGTMVAETPSDPFGVADFQREQAASARDAQGAIASLLDPGGGTQIPEIGSPTMGYLPPQWASASGFPIDEALTGRSAQDVLMGGPRPDPRMAIGSAPIGPVPPGPSPADVLAAGPRLRPDAIPEAFRPGPGGALGVDLGTMPAGMPLPPDRPGGAPDAGLVPMPPPRASGLPSPPLRPDLGDPSLSFNRQSGRGPDMRGELPPLPPMVAGRPEFPGALPAAPQADPSRSAAIQGVIDQGISDPSEIWGYLNMDRDGTLVGDIGLGEIQAVLSRNDYRSPDAMAAINDEFGAGLPFGSFPVAPPFESMVAGRPEFPGMLPAAREALPQPPSQTPARTDLSPEMLDRVRQMQGIGPFPARPEFIAPNTPMSEGAWSDPSRAFDISPPLTRMAERPRPPMPASLSPFPVGNLNYAEMPSGRLPPAQGAAISPGMGLGPYGMTPPPIDPDFDSANPSINLPPVWAGATSFPPPPAPVGTVGAGSTGGEWFTPAPPMPAARPAMSQGMRDQFNVAFSPGGPGMIADLPATAAARGIGQPSGATAQDGINSVFGGPPAAAQPPNLAIPFSEVTGYRPPPASGATGGEFFTDARYPALPSITPSVGMQGASAFYRPDAPDPTFAGGSVVRPPTPGVDAGVNRGTMPTPEGAVDIRPPVQGGPVLSPPMATPAPRQEQPRQTNVGADRQKQGLAERILGTVLGGPLVGGLFGGGGGGGFGLGQANAFTPFGSSVMNTGMGSFRTSGSSPYGNNGGSTNWQSGTSNALGGSNALSWTGSKGQPVTVVQDPWTGTYYGPTSP